MPGLNESDMQIYAYPNPFTHTISLELGSGFTAGKLLELALYAINGTMIYSGQKEIPTGKHILVNKLPQMAPGVYVLKVKSAGSSAAIRMIRE